MYLLDSFTQTFELYSSSEFSSVRWGAEAKAVALVRSDHNVFSTFYNGSLVRFLFSRAFVHSRNDGRKKI